MVEMMEMLRTLVRDKGHAASQQNSAVYPNQIKEYPIYPPGFTPLYAQM